MNPALISALLVQVVIPEIMAVIRAHQNATGGQTPTDAQVIAALGTDSNNVIQTGTAWLAAHPATPATPGTSPA